MATAAICLDQNQNSILCSDPDCTYGDCGSAAPQLGAGALCLDQNQNAVPCADPNCTFGDCTATASQSNPVAVAAATSSGPTALSNLIASATSITSAALTTQNQPKTTIVSPLGTFSSSGLTNMLPLLLFVLVALFALGAFGKKEAR